MYLPLVPTLHYAPSTRAGGPAVAPVVMPHAGCCIKRVLRGVGKNYPLVQAQPGTQPSSGAPMPCSRATSISSVMSGLHCCQSAALLFFVEKECTPRPKEEEVF